MLVQVVARLVDHANDFHVFLILLLYTKYRHISYLCWWRIDVIKWLKDGIEGAWERKSKRLMTNNLGAHGISTLLLLRYIYLNLKQKRWETLESLEWRLWEHRRLNYEIFISGVRIKTDRDCKYGFKQWNIVEVFLSMKVWVETREHVMCQEVMQSRIEF